MSTDENISIQQNIKFIYKSPSSESIFRYKPEKFHNDTNIDLNITYPEYRSLSDELLKADSSIIAKHLLLMFTHKNKAIA